MKKIIFIGILVLALALCVTPFAFAAEVDTPDIDYGTKTITVDSAEDLVWVSTYSQGNGTTELPASFSKWTILIANDIDLSNMTWKPIVDFHGSMKGVTDGNGSYVTISNFNVNEETGAGLCGNISFNEGLGKPYFANIMIANANITSKAAYAGAFVGNGYTAQFDNCHAYNVNVTATRFVGGIAGATYGNITDCSVSASSKEYTIYANGSTSILSSNGDNAGGIVGLYGEGGGTISNCNVSGITVLGTRQTGGIAGLIQYADTVSGCTVSDTVVHSLLATDLAILGTTAAAGGIVGQLQTGSAVITIIGNTVADNVQVSRGSQTNPSYSYCGWIVGDVTRAGGDASLYVIADNIYPTGGSIGEIGGR